MTAGARNLYAIVAAVLIGGAGFGQVLTSSDSEPPKEMIWKGPGGCVVDLVNTPCRTVRYHWSNFEWAGGTTTAQYTEAFDRDGSQSTTAVTTHRQPWFFSQQTWYRTELVLRKEHRTIYIDHERKIYETLLRAKAMPYWIEDDSQCSHAASSRHLSQRIPDSVIAGAHVVGYRGRDAIGEYIEEYFAPSIGCQEMRSQFVMRGVLGFKTSEYDMTVDSYEIGPPASGLFKVPAGYKQVASFPSR